MTRDVLISGKLIPRDIMADIRNLYSGDPIAWFLRPNPEFSMDRPIDMIGDAEKEARLRNRIECVKLGMFS